MSDIIQFLTKCKNSGIDPIAYLSKKADHLGDAHASEVGKQSMLPHSHSADPLKKTEMSDLTRDAAPDENRVTREEKRNNEGTSEPIPDEPSLEGESKEEFTQKAATLAVAMNHLKQAGLLRADLLKVAADALDVTPDYTAVLTPEAIIANAKAEDDPLVVAKLRQEKKASADLQDNLIWKIASQLANDVYIEE